MSSWAMPEIAAVRAFAVVFYYEGKFSMEIGAVALSKIRCWQKNRMIENGSEKLGEHGSFVTRGIHKSKIHCIGDGEIEHNPRNLSSGTSAS